MIHDRSELVEIRARLGDGRHHRASSCRAATSTRSATTPTRSACWRTCTRWTKPFEQVGIAGYPETHPKIDDDLTVQAMWDKRRHATHVVSNLTFDAGAIKSLGRAGCARRGVTMPAAARHARTRSTATKLLSMATKIGVGESTRFLAKNKGTFARLAAPGG